MKLASLKHRRDGQLIVVNQALSHYVDASHIAATLQAALDNWATCQPLLASLYQQLEAGEIDRHAVKIFLQEKLLLRQKIQSKEFLNN